MDDGTTTPQPNDEHLTEALGASQRLGLLGDRPIRDVIEHARHFVAALEGVTGSVVDLGSGGGTPGLVVAWDRPDLDVTLIDRRTKRTDVLSRLVRRLAVHDRVTVLAMDVERAVQLGHVGFDAATARGFGPPEATLGFAARCVRPGGRIVISEPPADPTRPDRWSDELLNDLRVERRHSTTHVACFERVPD